MYKERIAIIKGARTAFVQVTVPKDGEAQAAISAKPTPSVSRLQAIQQPRAIETLRTTPCQG